MQHPGATPLYLEYGVEKLSDIIETIALVVAFFSLHSQTLDCILFFSSWHRRPGMKWLFRPKPVIIKYTEAFLLLPCTMRHYATTVRNNQVVYP